ARGCRRPAASAIAPRPIRLPPSTTTEIPTAVTSSRSSHAMPTGNIIAAPIRIDNVPAANNARVIDCTPYRARACRPLAFWLQGNVERLMEELDILVMVVECGLLARRPLGPFAEFAVSQGLLDAFGPPDLQGFQFHGDTFRLAERTVAAPDG